MKPEEVSARITALQTEVEKLERELRITQGKLKNLDAERLKSLEEENIRLLERSEKLSRATLLMSRYLSQTKSDPESQQELLSLKTAAIESFKKENSPPELWKSLES